MWFIHFRNEFNHKMFYSAGPFGSEDCAINYAKGLSKNTKELGVTLEDYDNSEYMTLDNI